MKILSERTRSLQMLQNDMIKKSQCVNMQKLREKIKMMSVNHMVVYQTILEVQNVMKNLSSEHIKSKPKPFIMENCKKLYQTSRKASEKCTGFTNFA